jgi:outer membrane receptor protein involved in Fe transport
MHGNLVDDKKDLLSQIVFPENFINFESEGTLGEAQHLFNSERFHLTTGFGYFAGDKLQIINFDSIIPTLDFKARTQEDVIHGNAYSYGLINYPQKFTWTLGASLDCFDNGSVNTNQFNPKFGLLWNPVPDTTVRAAAFRALKRTLLSSSTLEPTQVAGFNQFYDDIDGTRAWKYGAAVDQKFSSRLFAGLEYSRRDLEVPVTGPAGDIMDEWRETLVRSYVYWLPMNWLALTTEYQFERLTRDRSAGSENFWTLDTHRLPLGIGFFHPSGLLARLKMTYVSQSGEFPDFSSGGRIDASDQFFVLDGSIGFRLPDRWGIVSLEVRNLLDETFRFQDSDIGNPSIFPKRTLFGKITLAF